MAKLNHLAVIMDGNGRYAQSQDKPRIEGHSQGANSVKILLNACLDLGIENITLFCFSTENWQRPREEIDFLMNLLEYYLANEQENLIKKNVKLVVIGDKTALPDKLIKQINITEHATQNGTMRLQLAINYGARQEITNAVKILGEKIANNQLNINEITEKTITDLLSCHDIGDPDLLVRTSGEMRISNFLLWQISYSEIIFEPKFWPEITTQDVINWVNIFQQRHRKYGKIN